MSDRELPFVPSEFLSGEVYRPLESITPEEAGVTLAELPEFASPVQSPFKKEQPPIVIGERFNLTHRPRVEQISNAHGRASLDSRTQSKVVWGNHYMARDYKGNYLPVDPQTGKVDFAHLQLNYDRTHPYEVRTEKMLDGMGLEDRVKNEKIMAELGLLTEGTARVLRLMSVPYEGTTLPIKEVIWKLHLKYQDDQTAHDRYTRQRLKARKKPEMSPQDYFATYLDEVEYFIVERHLQVAERVRDFEQAKTFADLLYLLHPTFTYLNLLVTGRPQSSFIETNHIFHLDRIKDIEAYFYTWLPKQMGYYLGVMHENTVTHGYAHQQNWSGVGTLYDLDSLTAGWEMRRPVPLDYYRIDLHLTLGDYAKVLENTILPMLFEVSDTAHTFPLYRYEKLGKALVAFMKSYLTTRYRQDETELALFPEEWNVFIETEIEDFFFKPGVNESTNDPFRLFNQDKKVILNDIPFDVSQLRNAVLKSLLKERMSS